MRKKLENNKWCVRCGKTTPSPYLKANMGILFPKGCDKKNILDIGCGNGRNMNYLNKYAGERLGLDMNPTCSHSEYFNLGTDPLPMVYIGWELILVNYVFMFLNDKERKQLINEIKRVASLNCKIVVELYPAKNSEIKNDAEMVKMQKQLIRQLGWIIIKSSKGKFIAQR